MDFNYSDDRRMLSDSLRRYLTDQYPIEQRNSVAYTAPYHSPDHWQALADLGVLGALITEADGGFGGDGFDIAVIFEELGRALCPEPVLGNLMALRLLAAFSATDHVNAVVAGSTQAALALYEANSPDTLADVATSATNDGGSWTLNGGKTAVYGGPCANLVLVAAKTDSGLGLFIATPSSIESNAAIDGGGLADMTFDNSPAECLSENAEQEIEAAIDAGRLALCAEAVGAADVLLEMTVDYLKQRSQFGQPIASFQALQHRVVDMATEIEQARSMTILAASKFDDAERMRFLAMAKNLIGRVATHIGEEATQLHGGIGMTWEYGGAHYTKRLIMLDHQLGDRYNQVHRLLEAS
ncbi:MAG: acyl-CoA dehydrogenase [Pseudomonadales bacterium]|nr:acyl-CoA dehydrogenase [Pseudomonadales bacterium]